MVASRPCSPTLSKRGSAPGSSWICTLAPTPGWRVRLVGAAPVPGGAVTGRPQSVATPSDPAVARVWAGVRSIRLIRLIRLTYRSPLMWRSS
jgi:hypothetical protein